jgi:hypothetical protein
MKTIKTREEIGALGGTKEDLVARVRATNLPRT